MASEPDPARAPAAGWVELFRSPRERAARERALVLAARGLPHALARAGRDHVLAVPAEAAPAAARELELYERENAGWPPRAALPALQPGAGVATAVYALLLVACFVLQERGALGRDWVAAGMARSALLREGAWWRAVTALTLHADLVHLGSNLLYGALFGTLAAWTLGGGLGWLVVLCSGALGNLGNAWIQGPEHASIGASTAVFGALGALAGAELRRRRLLREPRLRLAAPIVVALLLLSEMGVGDPLDPSASRVDVLAHVAGLAWGLPLGYLSARRDAERLDSRAFQAACGALALALVALAWWLALAA